MIFPKVALSYLPALSLLYAVLALVVVYIRRKHFIPFGDGSNESLLRTIRAHGNFIEYVLLASLVVVSLEAPGEPIVHVHTLMGALLVARVLHPIASASERGSIRYGLGRVVGALTT